MNKKNNIYILTISGILFALVLYKSYHYDNLFEIFIYPILGGIGFYQFYKGLFNEIEAYRKTKKLKSYFSTFTGFFLIILNIGIYSYYEIKLNSETLFKTENGFYGDFKKNGEYIIKNGSWASKTHFYGNYSIKDSILTLDRKGLDDEIISNRFAIRKYKAGENDSIKEYLIQIDKNGKEIKNFLTYEIKPTREIYISNKYDIVEDNRK
jgi:hypothetical protein